MQQHKHQDLTHTLAAKASEMVTTTDTIRAATAQTYTWGAPQWTTTCLTSPGQLSPVISFQRLLCSHWWLSSQTARLRFFNNLYKKSFWLQLTDHKLFANCDFSEVVTDLTSLNDKSTCWDHVAKRKFWLSDMECQSSVVFAMLYHVPDTKANMRHPESWRCLMHSKTVTFGPVNTLLRKYSRRTNMQ